jgi:hypothetical protein
MLETGKRSLLLSLVTTSHVRRKFYEVSLRTVVAAYKLEAVLIQWSYVIEKEQLETI